MMLSILDLRRRIENGELTPEGAVRLTREALIAEDDALGAFVTVDHAAVISRKGPLSGIAVGVKDIIDTADMPTEYGSPIYSGWRPKADAPLVSLAKRAGATIIGKTATTAFAHLDPTSTRNPHSRRHTPGGSSSGSAAAVAAGIVPLAFGTQTGGSIIRPASFCGVAAIKPSYRALPSVGIKAFSWSLDTPGLFAAGVADVAFALAALTGREEVRVDGRLAAAPKIAVVLQEFAAAPEMESELALTMAVEAASRAGAKAEPFLLPRELGEAFHSHRILQDFEARQSLAWEYEHHRDALPPRLRKALEDAQSITVADYDEARRKAHRARGVLGQAFEEVDIILTYSAPGQAPEGLASTGDPRFNRLWTLMGNPCVNVPVPSAASPLPVGVQVIAAFGKDAKALNAAYFLENAIRKSS